MFRIPTNRRNTQKHKEERSKYPATHIMEAAFGRLHKGGPADFGGRPTFVYHYVRGWVFPSLFFMCLCILSICRYPKTYPCKTYPCNFMSIFQPYPKAKLQDQGYVFYSPCSLYCALFWRLSLHRSCRGGLPKPSQLCIIVVRSGIWMLTACPP